MGDIVTCNLNKTSRLLNILHNKIYKTTHKGMTLPLQCMCFFYNIKKNNNLITTFWNIIW